MPTLMFSEFSINFAPKETFQTMTINRYRLPALLCGSLAATCAAASDNEKTGSAHKRPNILVLIADDISRDDFGCYGHPVIRTPNIDALAADGIRFTHAFLTTSSSSPSRASILTGRYPHNTGACELHTPIGEEQITVARVLRDAGYYTAQAGKWHFGDSPSKPAGPVLRDFDRTGGSRLDGGGASGAERWVEYLRERPRDKPFFMWFAAHDAHRGWDDDRSLARYEPQKVALPRFFVDDSPSREDFACYYYEVSRFDHFVGQVVDELRRQGIYDQTLIVVMADNGRPFARAKTRLIPDGIRTPFIVRCPASMRGKPGVCKSLVSVIDLAPTLADAAGAAAPPTFQGRSFKSLLCRPSRKFRNYSFAEHNWHNFEACERMVCTDRYLLIENFRPEFNAAGATDIMNSGSGRSLLKAYAAGGLDPLQADIFAVPRPAVELYDYRTDPELLHDLAAERPDVAGKLREVLRRWRDDTGDTVPERLTPDWNSRTTFEKLPAFGRRGEMPGQSADAIHITDPGPF